MLKNEFMAILKDSIADSKGSFRDDEVAIRTYFNDLSDLYCKDGEITESQYNNWVLTDRELKSILRMCKS